MNSPISGGEGSATHPVGEHGGLSPVPLAGLERTLAGEGGVTTKAAEDGLPVLLVRPEDAARVLGVGRTKVHELMRSGALRSVRMGGSAPYLGRCAG